MKNPKLDEAVAIFKKLGWEAVNEDNILELPLGTAEEKRIALAGLKSGDWGEHRQNGLDYFDNLASGFYDSNYHSYIDVEYATLVLFAIRVGVSASRAEELAMRVHLGNINSMLISAITSRGAKFATDFVNKQYRGYPTFHEECLILIDRLNLDIPQITAYFEHWADYVADTIEVRLHSVFPTPRYPEPARVALIQRRFKDNVAAGIAQHVPASPYFAAAIAAGVAQAWLERDYVAELAFSGLDASVRPSDRKIWLAVLDELKLSDAEFCTHTDMLIPVVATGDQFVINRLATVLIANAKGAQLTELLIAAFSIKTKKGKMLVMRAALGHKQIDDTEALAPWLEMLAQDADKAVSALAKQLMEQWGINKDK